MSQAIGVTLICEGLKQMRLIFPTQMSFGHILIVWVRMLPTRSTWAHFWMLISVLLVDFCSHLEVWGFWPISCFSCCFPCCELTFLSHFQCVGFLGPFLVIGCCCLCFLYLVTVVFGAFLRAPYLSEVSYQCLICWFQWGFGGLIAFSCISSLSCWMVCPLWEGIQFGWVSSWPMDGG